MTLVGWVLLTAPVVAQEITATSAQSDWKVIAKKSIRFRGLIQRIGLKDFAQPILGLKVRTRGRRMTFSSIKVQFRSGKLHHERRRIRLQSGETSSAFATGNQARLVDEIILIPDVSAPRRRAIDVEILALLGSDTTSQNKTASPHTEVTSPVENEGALTRPIGNVRTNASKTAIDEKSTGTDSLGSVGDRSMGSEANSTATTTLNTLSSAATDVALPSAKPKPRITSANNAPTSISLGSPTRGGELLIDRTAISRDSDVTTFDLAGKPNRFNRLRLHLSGSDIRIRQVVAIYADDSRHQEAFDIVQRRNTMSRWLNLDRKKPIARIELHSEATATKTSTAHVELLGEPILTSQLPDFERSAAKEGWFLIAAQTGRMIRGYDGQMPVAPNRGGFSKLRLVRIGRAPLPSQLILRTNRANNPNVSLVAAQSSNEFVLPSQQRAPIEGLQLNLSSRALERISNTDVFQIWAKF